MRRREKQIDHYKRLQLLRYPLENIYPDQVVKDKDSLPLQVRRILLYRENKIIYIFTYIYIYIILFSFYYLNVRLVI